QVGAVEDADPRDVAGDQVVGPEDGALGGRQVRLADLGIDLRCVGVGLGDDVVARVVLSEDDVAHAGPSFRGTADPSAASPEACACPATTTSSSSLMSVSWCAPR